MTTEKNVPFDPYRKWLGISKVLRPVTFYQLLGLSDGESDVEVIEEAAIRQISHLRNYQVGPHAAECTRLLNEVSTARQILVNPRKRQEYDKKLAQLAAKREAAKAAASPESAFADLDEAVVPAGKSRPEAAKPASPGKPGKRLKPKVEAKRLSRTVIIGAAAGGGVLLVGVVVLVVMLASPGTRAPSPPTPPLAQSDPPKSRPPVEAAKPDTKPPIVDTKPEAIDPKPRAVDPKNAVSSDSPVVDPKRSVEPDPVPPGTPTVRLIRTFQLLASAKNLVATRDGRLLYGGFPSIQQFDPGRDQHRDSASASNTGPGGLRFGISPDAEHLYVGSPDIDALEQLEYGGQRRRLGQFVGAGKVCAMALSPNGMTLVSASCAGDVWSWHAYSRKEEQKLKKHPGLVRTIVFSRDGDLVASMCEQMIQVWNLREKRLLASGPNDLTATSMDFSPDGKNLIVAAPAGLYSSTVERLDWTSLKLAQSFFLRIAFANDKTLAALAPNGFSVCEWPSLRLLRSTRLDDNPVDTMALTPNGDIAFVGSSSNTRLSAFAIEGDAVLKPHVPLSEIPAGDFVDFWHYPKNPDHSTQIDLKVRRVDGVYSAQIEVREKNIAAKCRVDGFQLVGDRLRGKVTINGELPEPWSTLREVVLEAPTADHGMRVRFSTDKLVMIAVLHRTEVDLSTPSPGPVVAGLKIVPTPVSRLDPPSDDKVKEITKTIRDSYKSDYAKKTPADRVELAEKLLKVAVESKDNPAARYVLYSEARDLGAAAGKWSIVADAFDQLGAGYKVDLLPQREAALRTFVKSSLSKESAQEAAHAALQGIGDAIVADQVPLAGSFQGLAVLAAAKSQNVPLISLVKKGDAELKLLGQEADAVKKAREALKTTPDDPAANLAVGRYESLRRGDWTSALPLLAKGGDGELPSLAHKELGPPKDWAGQQKIGDEWWALAEKEKDSTWVRAALRERAAFWYRQAVPQATGFSLTVMTERVKSIDESPSPFKQGAAATPTVEAKEMRGHKGAVTGLDERVDGKLFSSSLDGTVKKWDLKLAKNLTSHSHGIPIHTFAYSPNGRYLAVGFKESVKVIDSQGQTTARLLPNRSAVPGSFWVDDDQLSSFDGTEHVLDSLSKGGQAISLPMRISAVVASPRRVQAVTLGEETWILNFGKDGSVLNEHKSALVKSTAAAFSPTTSVVAVATSDKKIALYSHKDRTVMSNLEGAGAVTRCMAYAPSGERLYSGGDDGVVHVWDVNSGKEIRRFPTGATKVTSLIVTFDGKQIITGGSDGVIRLWPEKN